MGINITSSGNTQSFNLDALSKMAESVGNDDKIRGKSSKSIFTKAETFTLYASNKDEGSCKAQKREGKQQLAKEFLETALHNTVSSLPEPLQKGKLPILLSNIINRLDMPEIKGRDLKDVVKVATKTIGEEAKKELFAMFKGELPTLKAYNSAPQNQERINQLLDLVPETKLNKTTEDKVKTLARLWVPTQIESNGKLRNENLPQATKNLRQLVEEELSEGKVDPGTILRGNSGGTKFSTAYMKTVGGEYTTAILKPILDDLEKAGNLEVDPQKLGDLMVIPNRGETMESVKENMKQSNVRELGQIYDKLMDSLANSVKTMPQEMRDTCALTYALIKRAGGDDQTARNGASATIILRLLCPALTNPEKNAPNEGSLGKFQSPLHERAAMLLSKLFQNQANSVLEFKKNPGLEPLNGKLQSNNQKLQNFLNEVINSGKVDTDLQAFLPKQKEEIVALDEQTNSGTLDNDLQSLPQQTNGLTDLDKLVATFESQFGQIPETVESNGESNKNLSQVEALIKEFENK